MSAALKQMEKHLPLRAALILIETTAEKLSTTAYRLLHHSKAQDKGLPHEGTGYDDVVVKHLYRAVHSLGKAKWEVYRRWRRQSAESIAKGSGKPYEDLPEKDPSETDWSKFLPKIQQVTLPYDGLKETARTLKEVHALVHALHTATKVEVPTAETLKKVKTALSFIDSVIETAEKESP